MKTPILMTERMILRPLTIEDAKDIYDRWTSDPEVARYMRWNTHESVEVTREWLGMVVQGDDSDKSYDWAFVHKDTGYVFGTGGIYYKEECGCFEVGYNIMKKYWNQGYTTEAVKRILQFANEELGENEFVASHAIENPASGAVMKKCGFEYECDGKTLKFDGVTEFDTKNYRLKLPYAHKRAGIADLDELVSTRITVLRAANKLSDDVDMTEVEKESRAYYKQALESSEHIAYLVYEGGKFVGAGGVSFYQVMPTYHNPSGRKAYIMNMYTALEYRRQGIAMKTLDLLVRAAKEQGISQIALEATAAGRPLYEKYGFVTAKDEMELVSE